MFCYTIINSLNCVLRELNLWIEISSEHHTFLLKIAEFTGLKIDKNLEKNIKKSEQDFDELNKAVKRTMIQFPSGFALVTAMEEIRQIIDLLTDFLEIDKNFLSILDELKEIGNREKVWQALVGQITDEQKYMFSLFTNLLNQLQR